MNVQIFKNYEEFLQRQDKTINGVSEEWLDDYGLTFDDIKLINCEGLWNCDNCEGCINCENCFNCLNCTYCIKCIGCVDCTCCSNAYECKNCSYN